MLKPCVNTSPIGYNWFRGEADLSEDRQRSMNAFIKKQNKFNQEARRILNPASNSYSKIQRMHGTTKPLGKLYFDYNNSQNRPFRFSKETVESIMPPGVDREDRPFWH